MNRTLASAALALAPTVALASYCPKYEFAELQIMTLEELKAERAMVSRRVVDAFVEDLEITEADRAGCEDQGRRLDRVIKVRESEAATVSGGE
ncbi:hypothetical protein [Polycyclovorans algicola]|uniref:hypothetical protein n=1 Tax=Polycyclovorans algicola TaxID=616992 RepID=UPI0004A6B98A|nr:hypothetical protein [Polycyclovorans algicola]